MIASLRAVLRVNNSLSGRIAVLLLASRLTIGLDHMVLECNHVADKIGFSYKS